MHQLMVFGLLGLAPLLAGCTSKNDQASGSNAGSEVTSAAGAQEYFTVRAGPVPNAKVTALSGTFQLLKVSHANGIPSDGRGGACLVFAAADLGYPIMAGKSCTTNASCFTGENGTDGKPASAYYCEGNTKTCWARPGSDPTGNDTCNRPLLMSPTVLNPAPKTPVDAAAKLGIKPGAKVRVVACLNKGAPPYPLPGPGCAQVDSDDRIEEFGPVATVKP